MGDNPLQSAQWLSVTLHSIGDAVIATDRDAKITFMNSVAESLTGWSADDATGVPLERVFNIVNEETRQTVESPVEKALREGTVVGLANHTLLIAKDGVERPIDDSAAPILDETGGVFGVVLVFRDVSEQREAERMRASLAAIVESSEDAIISKNLDGVIQTWNAGAERIFGYSAQEAIGRSVSILIPPDRIDEEPRILNRIRRGERVEHYETVRRRKDGGLVDISLCVSPVLDAAGRVSGASKIARDISDRKRGVEALRDSEERYRRLFESSKDGILILDAETMRITDANPFMTELLGYSKAQFQGKELWEIGLFRDKAAIQAAIRELGETGYVRWNHLPLESDQGKIQEIELTGNIYREDDQIVAQCNIRDITDRREMERKLKDQARELGETDRRKDEFLAMLSHELRNPLTPIFNALQILDLEPDDDLEQAEARKVIARQTRQMANLVDDLLDVSRITTGRTRLQREPVEVNAMIEQAVETVRSRVDSKHQNLSVTLCPETLWLDADPTRLGQIMGNLLTNAYKYTEPGGHIWLSAAAENREVVIRVRDDGVGVPPESLPRIFEIFTQVDSSLERSEGGLGIGLALVKRLVDMHGGTVEAHGNGDERGTEFVVRLPRASEFKATPPQPPRPAFRAGSASSENGAGLRVLVVDDNADAAKMSSILLRNSGHEVRVAHTGPDALALAIDFLPQVVLLDIGLPGMDGYEVARRFRKNPQLADVTLVALTGYGQESDRQRSREAGFNHHLVKPVEHAVLTKLLSELPLSGRQQQSPTRAEMPLTSPRPL